MPKEESFEVRYNRLKTQLQNAILANYPNPERHGCPGDAIVKELAARPVDESFESFEGDPHWQHVTHCSECYREFLVFLDEIRRAQKTRHARISLAAAVVIVLAVGVFFAIHEFRHANRAPKTELAFRHRDVDFQLRAITRSGEGNGQSSPTPLVLDRAPEELSIRLPFPSRSGPYDVRIEDAAHRPLRSASGEASILNGTTTITVMLDLSKLEPGNYSMCIRRVPGDWACSPVGIQ